MAYSDYLGPISSGDSDLQKWAKLQAQVWQACVAAGIAIPSITVNPLLDNIRAGDSELQKFQKVQSFLQLLAQNISGGGGGASAVQAGVFSLTTSSTTQAITFGTAFSAAPSVICNLIPPGGGVPTLVDPSAISPTGFTAEWGFAIPAGYSLAWIANPKTQ